ncbi:MAG: helix-turn-helix transcriptional regulator [Faecousia sp.]
MKDRLFWLRKSELKLSREKFGERVGMSGSEIRNIEDGVTRLKENKIPLICREFNVNEVWLRTGEGEPFKEESREEQIMRFATQTVKGSDEFRKAFVSMLAKMDADDWQTLAKLFDSLADEIKKSE